VTFTYTPSSTPSDLTRVRFHTGQTVEAESFLTDEDISMILAEEGTWQKAVIASIKFIMARLSQPNFKADWLQVDNKAARVGRRPRVDRVDHVCNLLHQRSQYIVHEWGEYRDLQRLNRPAEAAHRPLKRVHPRLGDARRVCAGIHRIEHGFYVNRTGERRQPHHPERPRQFLKSPLTIFIGHVPRGPLNIF